MFIIVKGEKGEEIFVNVNEIKFIVPQKGGSTIIFGFELFLQSKSTVAELEMAIGKAIFLSKQEEILS